MKDPLGLAKALALLVPAGLLAGAYGSQYWGGLYPCDMCWWQRYAHIAALAFALLAFLVRGGALVWLAALAIAVSGGIGFYHAGVELDYFEGFTECTGTGARTLEEIMAMPFVRCDEVQWSWLGVSMAGWNAILSIAGALVILWLSVKKPKAA